MVVVTAAMQMTLRFQQTKKKNIPDALVSNEKENEPGKILVEEIHRAGFTLNHNKNRVSRCTSRQQVTGLTVNKK